YCKEFAQRLNYPLTGEMMLDKIRQQESNPNSPKESQPQNQSQPNSTNLNVPSPQHMKIEFDGQLTPPDGSVRSDEGYNSHGYPDDAVLTPPEDFSDSDNDCNNCALDFSKTSTKLEQKGKLSRSILQSILLQSDKTEASEKQKPSNQHDNP